MLHFLIARLSVSQTCKRRTHLGFLLRNASHIFNSFSSVSKSSESNQPKHKQEGDESFTVSYLRNTLGLSPKVAIAVSKKVDIKTPEKVDSVLNLLRSYGFSDTHISKIVKSYPQLLLVRPESNLLPKLRFFQSIGFSGSELPELLINNCRLLTWSLKNRIIPGYEALRSVVNDDKKLVITRKPAGWNFLHCDVANLIPNIMALREHGAPQSSINLLLNSFASAAFTDHAKFVEHVKFLKEIGSEPSKTTFVQAINVLSMTKKSSWESKLKVFERCGWSRDVTLSVFCKYPFCMMLSEMKITKAMKFLVDGMGFSLEDIAKCPTCLGYSLKLRIIPRCLVVKILKKKGFIKNDISLSSIFIITENKFLEKYVVKFQKSIPELFNIYGGQLGPLPEVLS